MKNYILFMSYFLIINFNASSDPFAAFLLDEETQEELARRVMPILQPLTEKALTLFPLHPNAQNLRIDVPTLDVDPQILNFSPEKDKEDPHSLKKFHLSLSLKNTFLRSLQSKLEKAHPLLRLCRIKTTGAKEMGRYIAISLTVDPSPLKDKASEDLVKSLTNNAHVSVAKFTDAQRDFIYLKSGEIAEKKTEDMFENLSLIFRSYTKDMRTLASQHHDSSADKMETDSESPPTTPQKSPLGKGGRSPRRPLESLQSEGTISPRKSPDRICKKTDLSPSTLLSQVFLSPSRAKARAPKSLAPQRLFPDSPERAAAPNFPSQPISNLAAKPRRDDFLHQIEQYAKVLASELATQTEKDQRKIKNFPSVVGLNVNLIKRDKDCAPTKDKNFMDLLSYGIKVQLLGLFNGAIKAEYKGKENVYHGKLELYYGEKSLDLSLHEQIVSQQVPLPISMDEEGLRLESLRSYLHELYKVDYKKERIFNEELSSLVPDGSIWKSQIDLLNQKMREESLPITLGELVTARIP